MSTSLLYHAFGIRGYEYTRTDYQDGQVIFTIHQEPETAAAPPAARPTSTRAAGSSVASDRCPSATVPPSSTCPSPRRMSGLWLGAPGQDPLRRPAAELHPPFERYALELSRRMTIRDVAKHLGVSWDVIKDIQKRDLSRRFAKPKLKHLRHIAIDEIAIAKGHRYLTMVMDLESGAVVFVGDGKGAEALKPFWKRLRPSKARSRRWPWTCRRRIAAAVSTNLPKAKIVFDRFHVVKLFNEKLSELRSDVVPRGDRVLHKKVLKGTRWLLLKNPENLDEKKDEKKKLKEALALNQPLAMAYYMKEDLRRFWEQPGKKFATMFLDGWIRRAAASGIKVLQQMAKTLAAHRMACWRTTT